MKATPQAITKAIKAIDGLDISKSVDTRGRVSTFTNEGYKITKTLEGWNINYVSASSGMNTQKAHNRFYVTKWTILERIFIELSSAGYDVTYNNHTISTK